jgi:adenylate kinase
MIIAITGTPGTGKSLVAAGLASRLGWKLVILNELAEEKGLYMGYDEERKCKVVDIGGLAEEVTNIRKDAIIESHYAHDMPADVIVVLRTDPQELRDRLVERGWNAAKIEENVEAEIMEVCKGEALDTGRKVLEIDTTGKKPIGVVENIVTSLKIE